MTARIDTPGVLIERVDTGGPRIAGVRTDIAAFVGIARRGPVATPVAVESYRQFESHFGGATGAAYLAYAVRAFFENGGARAWIVRVATDLARAARVMIHDTTGRPTWSISAGTPGVWGDELRVSLRASRKHAAVSPAGASTARHSDVSSVTGFSRGSFVEIRQPGMPPMHRVVSAVDPEARRLYWVHPDRGAGLASDMLLSGVDLDEALQLTSLAYELLVLSRGALVGRYADLALVAEHADHGPRRDPGTPPLIRIDALDAATGLPVPLAEAERVALSGGRDGVLTLAPRHFIDGITSLDDLAEVAIVAVPDIVIRPVQPPPHEAPPPPPYNPCVDQQPPPEPRPIAAPTELPPLFSDDAVQRVYAALIEHCERHDDRFALLDTPLAAALPGTGAVGAVRAWRRRFETRHAGLFFPWVATTDPLGVAPTRRIPPSGHVAGQMAKTDIDIGVHRAPANRVMRWVQGVTLPIDGAAHGLCNTEGINVLRPMPGRGVRIMGARTVSSDPDWRFVSVQRLVMMIKKALELSTQWTVFEPNNPLTRTKVRVSVDSYLRTLFQQGAFAGDSVEASYYVKCDAENNPPELRERGRLMIEIGIAPTVPFEFVVVRLGRETNAVGGA